MLIKPKRLYHRCLLTFHLIKGHYWAVSTQIVSSLSDKLFPTKQHKSVSNHYQFITNFHLQFSVSRPQKTFWFSQHRFHMWHHSMYVAPYTWCLLGMLGWSGEQIEKYTFFWVNFCGNIYLGCPWGPRRGARHFSTCYKKRHEKHNKWLDKHFWPSHLAS